MVEDRVGDEGDDQSDEGTDHAPVRHDHAADEIAEGPVDTGGDGGQVLSGLVREVGERDGEDLDGRTGQGTGDDGEEQIDETEGQSQSAADGEHAPAPGVFGVLVVLGFNVFRHGHDTLRADRSHREGEFFHIGRDTEEAVAEDQVGELSDEGADEHHGDRRQPVDVEEGALRVGVGCERWRVPAGEQIRDAVGGGGVRLDEELMPEEAACRGRAHQGAGHVEQDEDFGFVQIAVGAFRDFDEEDDGNPLGGAADALTGQQAHVDGARHHQQGDEYGSEQGGPAEALLERGGDFHDFSELIKFRVDLVVRSL